MSNIIEGLIEGGKATTGPPFGPALGPMGVNTQAVIKEINEKTKDFSGIKISVKVIVDPATKNFSIEIGSPQTSALILKELKIEKGAKTKEETVGNITLDQIKKIAKAKDLFGATLADKVKQVLGTCKSMGITCDGEIATEVIKKINDKSITVE
ncbi:MAG: 50S ribosomal protein L11 [Candidatus Marsarchaeota archaeon]|nr:50S ribosomal protein L11 [Candidatus Marsarchaeota archaeon]MCL5105819.1 50S ribosomal protein L11 [Candidatus Marsarchaeota archaeon]